MAAEPVAGTAAPAVGSSGVAGQLTQLVLGLLLVVGLIFFLAWLLRRVQQAGPAGKGQVIELIGSRALGPRDRLVLVQVGNEQILLGLTPGTITALHVLKESVQVPSTEQATPEFAQRLMELLGKDQKDKK
nr:flagellar biosynthetic protein FliO [Pseudomonas chlororaphis]